MLRCLSDGKFGFILWGDFEKACSMIQATDWDTILSNDVDDATVV